MGILRHVTSGRTANLPFHAVAGRDPGSAVHLRDPTASWVHASVRWTGARWEVRDRGSKNDTFLDGQAVEDKEYRPLSRGARLRFGCDAELWELADDGGPAVVARSLTTGETRTAQDGLLAFPGPDDVQVSILLDSADHWVVEARDGARRPAINLERIQVEDQIWEISVPPESPGYGTVEANAAGNNIRMRFSSLTLTFHASPDGKHVYIEAADEVSKRVLGERACFFLLLLLARRRIEDRAMVGKSEGEQGWIHVIDAMTMLQKREEGRVNVDVLRARQEFASQGIDGAEAIVQRRPRELRLGTAAIEIVTD